MTTRLERGTGGREFRPEPTCQSLGATFRSFISAVFLCAVIPLGCASEVTKFDFTHRATTERSGAQSWIFEADFKPPLDLSSNSGFVNSVNAALSAAKLSPVDAAVPERSEITKQRWDRATYYYASYPEGPLRISRSLCRGADNKDYNCVWKLTVDQRPRP